MDQAQADERARLPGALPGQLRRTHRHLLHVLRLLATETHALHRIWYKGSAQFRHMLWWKPVHRVRVLGAKIATGPLEQSVPLARSSGASSGTATQHPVVPLERGGASAHGAVVLWQLAEVYASLWGEQAEACETCV